MNEQDKKAFQELHDQLKAFDTSLFKSLHMVTLRIFLGEISETRRLAQTASQFPSSGDNDWDWQQSLDLADYLCEAIAEEIARRELTRIGIVKESP